MPQNAAELPKAGRHASACRRAESAPPARRRRGRARPVSHLPSEGKERGNAPLRHLRSQPNPGVKPPASRQAGSGEPVSVSRDLTRGKSQPRRMPQNAAELPKAGRHAPDCRRAESAPPARRRRVRARPVRCGPSEGVRRCSAFLGCRPGKPNPGVEPPAPRQAGSRKGGVTLWPLSTGRRPHRTRGPGSGKLPVTL